MYDSDSTSYTKKEFPFMTGDIADYSDSRIFKYLSEMIQHELKRNPDNIRLYYIRELMETQNYKFEDDDDDGAINHVDLSYDMINVYSNSFVKVAAYIGNNQWKSAFDVIDDAQKTNTMSISDANYCKGLVEYNMYLFGNKPMLIRAARSILKACKRDGNNVAKFNVATEILMRLYSKTSYGYDRTISDLKLLKNVVKYGKQAIKLESNIAQTYTRIGEAYHLLSMPDVAIKYLNRSLKLVPNSANTKLVMATAIVAKYDSNAKYKEALEYVDQALSTGRSPSFALAIKADIQVALEDTAGLRKTLQQLEPFEPEQAVDWMWRGELYIIAGNRTRAEYYMKIARNRDPSVKLLGEYNGYNV